MKDNNSKKIEGDLAERVENETKKNLHELREMEQEKIFLEEINEHLEKNETISKDIFERFSHELRTPIVTIKAYADMILDGKYGELTPLQKEKLMLVEENTVLLIDTIMKMLDKIKERE